MFPDEVKFVVFAIGGQHTTKQLPTERIKEICSGINNPIVLLGGKEDQKVGKEISEKLEHVYNLCGITTLNESAYIVTKSTVVITHDTGIMHIAAAFKKDVFSIWGNTVPEFGMYPYLAGANSEIFEVKDLKCRPCSKIGFKKCPKKHFDCMQKQDIQAIIEKTNNLLGK
jgi:ADP-heptose:LPS heptosyltransferase